MCTVGLNRPDTAMKKAQFASRQAEARFIAFLLRRAGGGGGRRDGRHLFGETIRDGLGLFLLTRDQTQCAARRVRLLCMLYGGFRGGR